MVINTFNLIGAINTKYFFYANFHHILGKILTSFWFKIDVEFCIRKAVQFNNKTLKISLN